MTTANNWSFVRYVGDGHTQTFALTVSGADIGYLRTEDMRGYVDGVLVDTSIDVSTPHLIRFTVAPALGTDVLIRREMPIDEPYADFSRGNVFSQKAVNSSFLQLLYLVQEILDGFFPEGFYFKQDIEMNGHRIKGLGEAIENDDAVKKIVVDTLREYVDTVASRISKFEDVFNPVTATAKKDISMGNHLLRELADAVHPDDAISKKFTDALASRILSLESAFGPGSSFLSVPFIATEGQRDFHLPVTTTAAFCIKNGAFLNQAIGDYTVVGGNTLRMSEPQEAGASINVIAGIAEMSLWVNGIKSPNGTTWYPVMSDAGVLTWEE